MLKIDTLVDFPIEGLDIGKYVVNEDTKKESFYALFAIGNHSGSLSFGHYYAYEKNHIKVSDLSLMIILCLKLMNQVG